MIDLDHNATTPMDSRVREALRTGLERDDLGNPSSQHARGRAARDLVEAARDQVARATGAEPLGVTWTSGGTESDNLGVLGAARALRARRRPYGVLSAPTEHPAVIAAVARLAVQGHPVEWVPVDASGRIDPEAVADRLRDHPEIGLCSLAAANHELGNVYDVPAWVRAARQVRSTIVVHVDAVQALGKCPVSLSAWDADLLSISAHKIGGPVGIGALVHRRGLVLEPLHRGGAQERGRRAGTEPAWLIHGFGVAAHWASHEQRDRFAHTNARRERLLAGLRGLGARIHGDLRQHSGNTLNVGFDGCPGELLMMNLDLAGIAVSTGAACSSGGAEPSPVLLALGQSTTAAREAIRLSLHWTTTDAEVDATLTALGEIVPRVRAAFARRSAS